VLGLGIGKGVSRNSVPAYIHCQIEKSSSPCKTTSAASSARSYGFISLGGQLGYCQDSVHRGCLLLRPCGAAIEDCCMSWCAGWVWFLNLLIEQGSAWIKGIATDDLFMVHGTRFCKHRIQVLYLTVASLIIIFIVRTCPEYVDLQILYMAKVAQLGPHMDLFGWFWFSWRPWRWVFRQSFWIFLFCSWISIWSCSHYLCSRFFS
jgi:hypothetical protein